MPLDAFKDELENLKLDKFAQNDLSLGFGDRDDSPTAKTLRGALATKDFARLSTTQVPKSAEIEGATGAYSPDKNPNYLSEVFPSQNTERYRMIAALLLEKADVRVPISIGTGEFYSAGNEAAPQEYTSSSSLVSLDERSFATPILNFDGQSFNGVVPPDTVGDVGIDYYIQMVNSLGGSDFTIYNKSDGSVALGPITLDTLAPPGTPGADGRGDPIVLYDHLADRWLLSEFSGVEDGLSVFISQTGDPTDNLWNHYFFETPEFPDYPKYGVWEDAYYVSSNESSPAVYALDRTNMLQNLPAATPQRFTAPDLAGFDFQALTPADLDGPAAPAGSPGYFMRHRDDEAHNLNPDPNQDFLEVWAYDADFSIPGNSSFSQVANISISEFDSDLNGLLSFETFPQPGTDVKLDSLREVIMHRLQYRNFGTHETLVGNFVTDVDGTDRGGVRWFELRKDPNIPNDPWTLFQEGTVAFDEDNRWMGAIAMDGSGNIALGYNVSSETTFPSIRYTGRLATDPLGTMPQGENTLIEGTGSQSVINRWGDYSAMSVDPVDDSTFWFTGEYVLTSGEWATRIGSFSFDPVVEEPNDTISEAIDTGLSSASPGTFSTSSFIGDNPNIEPEFDVDFFAFQLNVGDRVTIDIDADELFPTIDSVLRLFDSSGVELVFSGNDPAPGEPPTLDSFIDFTAPFTDTFFVGLSVADNSNYDPFFQGSGTGGSTGDYNIEIVVTPQVENLIVNGSFETGNFSGWTVSDLADPFFPVDVLPTGSPVAFTDFVPEFEIQATDGNFAATHGFDGDGPGTIRIAQDVTIPANITDASLTFDYRLGFDLLNFGALLDRVFEVTINEPGGGGNLASFEVFTAPAGTFEPDTGNLSETIDLLAFAGQTVQVAFDTFIPEFFTGPAGFQLDNVMLTVVRGEPIELIGTEDDDVLTGTDGPDLISGLGGNDIIQALAGNDEISGGRGNDLIAAGGGNDAVTGNGGRDDILGGEGEDVLSGGAGADRILGESGDDTIAGDNGNDTMDGGEGSDLVSGDGGRDRVFGGIGEDSLSGGTEADTLTGGFDNDSLDGGDGNDTLIGVDPVSPGAEVGFGAGEVDTLTGAAGSDTFVLGDENRIYYDDGDPFSRGESDFALITDFDSTQDFIQLRGSAELYRLDFFTSELGTIDADLLFDPGVSARGEVIATLQDISPDLSLSDPSFIFV